MLDRTKRIEFRNVFFFKLEPEPGAEPSTRLRSKCPGSGRFCNTDCRIAMIGLTGPTYIFFKALTDLSKAVRSILSWPRATRVTNRDSRYTETQHPPPPLPASTSSCRRLLVGVSLLPSTAGTLVGVAGPSADWWLGVATPASRPMTSRSSRV